MTTIAGIDYSLTSPAICICNDAEEFHISNCLFFYLTSIKKYELGTDRYRGMLFPEYEGDIERYNNISQWTLTLLDHYDVEHVFIEGYSMGSKGRVFNIAENTALLKYKLWLQDYPTHIYPPTVIKKFATGKGNANKELMQEEFIAETGYNLKQMLGQSEKQWNPSSDIIDAYWIAKLGSNDLKVGNI
jgi:Holliday junction resolvasome RuvABC endonuclease subunit